MFHGLGVQRYFRHHISTHVNLSFHPDHNAGSNRNRINHQAEQLTNWPWLTWWITLPETNIFAPENGWLAYDRFLFLGFGLFSGAFAMFAVSFRVKYWNKFHPRIHVDSKNRFKSLVWLRFFGINLRGSFISQGKSFWDGPKKRGRHCQYLPTSIKKWLIQWFFPIFFYGRWIRIGYKDVFFLGIFFAVGKIQQRTTHQPGYGRSFLLDEVPNCWRVHLRRDGLGTRDPVDPGIPVNRCHPQVWWLGR